MDFEKLFVPDPDNIRWHEEMNDPPFPISFINSKITNMHQKIEGACRVVMRDGRQYLAMPSGEIIPMQVWTRVTDPVNPQDKPYMIVKVFVNLDDTVEEADQKH